MPRLPVGPLAVHFCARVLGCTVNDYTTNANVLADSVLRFYERFKPDAVWISADTWVSAQAMGAKVGSTGPDQPFTGVGEPLVQSSADIERIPRVDPATQGRYPLMLEALSRIVAQLGQDVFVVACFDQYPFSLAAALMGIKEVMLKLVDDPPFVKALMHRCSEYAVSYARALSQAGAHMLSGGDSAAGLIGPRLYRDHALPHEQHVISGIKAATSKPVSLHICGNATALLPLMKTSGADILEIDHQVELGEATSLVGRDIVLWGNLDPVGLLAQGSPEQVVQAVQRIRATVDSTGHRRFVLSSGCTLAMETPFRNIEALLRAAA